MKLKTFVQPIITEQQHQWRDHEKRVFANASEYECRFVYNLRNKTIYDAIMNDSYRMNSHELVFSVHDDLEGEADNCVRLSFCTERYANGTFLWDDLGIIGLRVSELYGVDKYGLDKNIFNKLKKSDLDNIEAYIISLKQEWYSMQNED